MYRLRGLEMPEEGSQAGEEEKEVPRLLKTSLLTRGAF